MKVFHIEHEVEKALSDYILARKMKWYPGTRNIDLVEDGRLPVMWVRRSLVFFEKICIPLGHKVTEVPSHIAAEFPIPLRREAYDDVVQDSVIIGSNND